MENDPYLLQKYDVQRIKSLELQALRNLLPQYEEKYQEVSAQAERLEREMGKIKQSLAVSQVNIEDLRKTLNRKRVIFQEISTRGNKVEQELSKINVMSPVYKHQINNFSKTLEEKFNKPQGKDTANSTDWSSLEKELKEEDCQLEEKIQEQQSLLDEFVHDYI